MSQNLLQVLQQTLASGQLSHGAEMTRIKAAVAHAFGQPLSIEEVELAHPKPGEVEVTSMPAPFATQTSHIWTAVGAAHCLRSMAMRRRDAFLPLAMGSPGSRLAMRSW